MKIEFVLLFLCIPFLLSCTSKSIDWESPRYVEVQNSVTTTHENSRNLALIVPRFKGSLSTDVILLKSIDGVPVDQLNKGLFGSPPSVIAVRPGKRVIQFDAGRNFASMKSYTIEKVLVAGRRYEIGYDCRYGDGYTRTVSSGYTNWDKGNITGIFPNTVILECHKPNVWITEIVNEDQ